MYTMKKSLLFFILINFLSFFSFTQSSDFSKQSRLILWSEKVTNKTNKWSENRIEKTKLRSENKLNNLVVLSDKKRGSIIKLLSTPIWIGCFYGMFRYNNYAKQQSIKLNN